MLLDTEQAHLEVSWIAKYQDIYACMSQEIGGMVQQKRDADTKCKGSGSSTRLERMKLSVFSGNIRDYPQFRSDFERHILPELESDETGAYVLKSC